MSRRAVIVAIVIGCTLGYVLAFVPIGGDESEDARILRLIEADRFVEAATRLNAMAPLPAMTLVEGLPTMKGQRMVATLIALSTARLDLGDLVGTRRAVDRLARLAKPLPPSLAILQSRLLIAEGKREEADRFVSEGISQPEATTDLWLLAVEFAQDDDTRCVALLRRLEESRRTDVSPFTRLGGHLERRQAWYLALEVYRSGLRCVLDDIVVRQRVRRIEAYLARRPLAVTPSASDDEPLAHPGSAVDPLGSVISSAAQGEVGRLETGPRLTEHQLAAILEHATVGVPVTELRQIAGEPTRRTTPKLPTGGSWSQVLRPERMDYLGLDGTHGIAIQVLDGRISSMGAYVQRRRR